MDPDVNADAKSIDEALGKKNVEGKLFHRNSHTTGPQWIKSFQEEDYNSISVILNAKLEKGTNRVVAKRKDNRTSEVKQYYDFFIHSFPQVYHEDKSWNR